MRKCIVAALIILSSCEKDNFRAPVNLKGEILFISRRIPNSADWQMVLMNADGTNQRLVTESLVRCTRPVLSNHKNKIAFTTFDTIHYYNLYVVDRDGQNLKLLSSGRQFCGSPAWSPDDNTISFVKNNNDAGGNYHVYLVKVNGGNETRLTHENDNFTPGFISNDRIVYTSAGSAFTGIYSMQADGSGKQLLTPQNRSFSSPVVSPDKTKIAITSNDWNGSQVFVMRPDGTSLKQLTFTVSPRYFDTGFPRDANSDPVWSPNSSTLAYVSYENASPDIFTINANGIGNRRLTDTPLRDEDPCWTADGDYIIFSSNRNANVSSEVYIMGKGGQAQTPLSNYIGDDIYPAFISK